MQNAASSVAEALIIKTLKDKRAEINGRIAAYMAQIAQAKHDLAHINASIRLFSEAYTKFRTPKRARQCP